MSPRDEILDAALDLFIEQGYSGTSMRAIAKAAGGRAVSGVYNHFPGKEDIFHALMEERSPYDEVVSLLEGIDAPDGPSFLREALTRMLILASDHAAYVQLVQIDAREFGGAHFNLTARAVMPRIMPVMGHALSLPGLRPVEPLVFTRLLASVLLGFVTVETFAPPGLLDQFTAQEWAAKIADVVLTGLVD